MLYSKGYALAERHKPVLLILHGLFGSSTNWHSIARRLAASHRVYALDLPNHGRSPWCDAHDYLTMAEAVAGFISHHDLGKVAVLGHSMGGKVAMQLALTKPHCLKQLIVADMAPVCYQSEVHADIIKALQSLDLSKINSRKAADIALEKTIPHATTRAFLLQNLVFNQDQQIWQWQLNLSVLLQALPAIMAFPKPLSLSPCSVASLFIYGKNSTYLNAENQIAAQNLFPESQFIGIDKAGHWLHAEQADAFYTACSQFLNSG